ncbi:hypothetical protein [Chryseobacterium sp. T1]
MTTTRLQKILFVLAIFFVSCLNAQIKENSRLEPSNLKYKDCDLQERNNNWLHLITNENQILKRIVLIKEKLDFDTIYKKYNSKITIHSPSINLENIDNKGNPCGIKILFILEYGKRKSIHIDLSEEPNYREILENINKENISIQILNPQQGAAIYGMSGSSGVIYMKTKSKDLKKIIKQVVKKNVG